jgi:hypothetical protein
MTDRLTHTVTRVHYYIVIAVLILSLLSSVVSLGYTARRIDELDVRVAKLETDGSVSARIAANDIQWLKQNISDLKLGQNKIDEKLTSHMTIDKK